MYINDVTIALYVVNNRVHRRRQIHNSAHNKKVGASYGNGVLERREKKQ